MKKFIAKLMGWHEQRSGADKFHQQEQIEHDLAEERRREAMEHEQERLRDLNKKRQVPSEAELRGPSDSNPSDSQES